MLFSAFAIPPVSAIVYRDDETDPQVQALSQQQQFSGAGIISGASGGGSGVAIAPGWVLTAKHVITGGTTATFFYQNGNGYSAGSVSGTVYTDPNSDLGLVHLDSSLPTNMAFITPNFDRNVVDRLMWSVGFGTYGRWTKDAPNYFPGNNAPRAGTNITDHNTPGFLGFTNDNTAANSTEFEATTGPGDSGGPMYLQDGNQWFVAGAVLGVANGAFVDTDVKSNSAWITSTITGVTPGFTFTPKAASLALTWDSASSTRNIQDGSGVWDLTRTNFHDGTFNYSWDNSLVQKVTFGNGGTSGTVTLGAAIIAGQIAFAQSGYILSGSGSNTLTLSGTTPGIDSGAAAVSSQINAPLRGSGILLTNSGTVSLGGADDNSSVTFTVNGGTLQLNKASSATVHALGGTVTVNAGGHLQLTGTGGDQILDSGGVTLAGGTFDLNGQTEAINSLTGTSGTVDNSKAAAAELKIGAGNGGGTFSGVIKNSGSALALTKLGSGTAVLGGANTYSGATSVQAGTLRLLTASALGASSGVSVTNTTVTGGVGTTLELQGGVTFSGVPLSLSSDSASDRRVTLLSSSGANTWGAGLTLNGSGLNILNVASGAALTVSGAISAGTGAGGTGAYTGTLFLRGVGNGTLSGPINLGSGSVAKTDGNTWTIASSGNSWAGTGVSVGTLKLGADNALPLTTVVTLGQGDASGATLDLNGFNQTIAGLALNSTGGAKVITNTGALKTLTVAANAASSFGGAINGALNLAKSGAASLTLTGSNGFTGSTAVSGGTLLVSGSLSGTTSVTAQSATVQLGGADEINNSATLSLNAGTFATGGFSETLGALNVLTGAATLDLGSGASLLHLASSAANAAQWTGILSITNWSGSLAGGGTDELFFGTSAAGLTAGQLADIHFISPANLAPGTYGAKILATGEVVAIPEPSLAWLLLTTVLCITASVFRPRFRQPSSTSSRRGRTSPFRSEPAGSGGDFPLFTRHSSTVVCFP